MNTKLTLTIEQEIINRAKAYAKEKNRSLSDIIENYLKFLTEKKSYTPENMVLEPEVEYLKGSFKEPKDLEYKKELQKRRENKYL